MRDALAAALASGDTDDDLRMRVGTVSGTSPVEVSVGGQTGLPASYLASYTPGGGDTVLILQNKTDLCIVGKLHSGG